MGQALLGSDPAGTSRFTYDAQGRVLSQTDADGDETDHFATDAQGNTVSGYNLAGQFLATVLPATGSTLNCSKSGCMMRRQPPFSLLLPLMLTSPCRAGCAAPTGPPTLLDFWATTCGPCRPALAAVQALHARFPGLRVLGVAMDGPDTAVGVRPLLRQHNVTYPVRVAPAANLRLALSCGVRVYPTLFLLDGRGHTVWSHGGALDAHAETMLTRHVAALLAVHEPSPGHRR